MLYKVVYLLQKQRVIKPIKTKTMKTSEKYARFCLESNHAGTIEIGNMTYSDSVKDAKQGVESGEYYDVDYFTWDGEKIDLN